MGRLPSVQLKRCNTVSVASLIEFEYGSIVIGIAAILRGAVEVALGVVNQTGQMGISPSVPPAKLYKIGLVA